MSDDNFINFEISKKNWDRLEKLTNRYCKMLKVSKKDSTVHERFNFIIGVLLRAVEKNPETYIFEMYEAAADEVFGF